MDRIVLTVNDTAGRIWRNTPDDVKTAIGKKIEDILKKTETANFELLLSEARKEAAANGLTEEILQSLLNEE